MTTERVVKLRGVDPAFTGKIATLVNYEAEQALLAGLLTDNRHVARVEDIVQPQHFADPVHGRIYTAIRDLHHRGHLANFITLKAKFDQDGALEQVGGAKYLAKLENAVVTMLGLPDYAWTIRDLANRRECVMLAEDLALSSVDAEQPIDTVASQAAGKLRGLVTGESVGQTTGDVAERIVADLQRPPRYVRTGMPRLDNSLGGGLYAGKLYAIAARKKVGKTTIMGTLSYNLNHTGVRHQFIALEMSPAEIEHRNMARNLDVNAIKFLTRDDKTLVTRAAEYAATVPRNVFYEHAPGMSLDDLERAVIRGITRDRTSGFFLDYWQLVTGQQTRDSEERHLRNVAQKLADICQREQVWGVVAVQLNQEGNARGGEGIKLAVDCYLALHREKGKDFAWIEMQECRYTPYRNIGSELDPGLLMHHNGPWFEDVARDSGGANG